MQHLHRAHAGIGLRHDLVDIAADLLEIGLGLRQARQSLFLLDIDVLYQHLPSFAIHMHLNVAPWTPDARVIDRTSVQAQCSMCFLSGHDETAIDMSGGR